MRRATPNGGASDKGSNDRGPWDSVKPRDKLLISKILTGMKLESSATSSYG